MPVIPKIVAHETDETTEQKIKETPEARFARILVGPVDFTAESSHPQGGKGAQNLFLRIKSGDEELVSFNMGLPQADPMKHNNDEADLCRRMAAALLANAAACDAVNEQIKAHMIKQAVAKVAKIRAQLDKAQTPAARRDVIKGFGLHTSDLEALPNGKRFDEAVEAMLEKMVTFE